MQTTFQKVYQTTFHHRSLIFLKLTLHWFISEIKERQITIVLLSISVSLNDTQPHKTQWKKNVDLPYTFIKRSWSRLLVVLACFELSRKVFMIQGYVFFVWGSSITDVTKMGCVFNLTMEMRWRWGLIRLQKVGERW